MDCSPAAKWEAGVRAGNGINYRNSGSRRECPFKPRHSAKAAGLGRAPYRIPITFELSPCLLPMHGWHGGADFLPEEL